MHNGTTSGISTPKPKALEATTRSRSLSSSPSSRRSSTAFLRSSVPLPRYEPDSLHPGIGKPTMNITRVRGALTIDKCCVDDGWSGRCRRASTTTRRFSSSSSQGATQYPISGRRLGYDDCVVTDFKEVIEHIEDVVVEGSGGQDRHEFRASSSGYLSESASQSC